MAAACAAVFGVGLCVHAAGFTTDFTFFAAFEAASAVFGIFFGVDALSNFVFLALGEVGSANTLSVCANPSVFRTCGTGSIAIGELGAICAHNEGFTGS